MIASLPKSQKRQLLKECTLYYDIIFKIVFRDNVDILGILVSDILSFEVSTPKYAMSGYELLPTRKDQKIYKSDLLIKIDDLHYIMIEVNFQKQRILAKRNKIMFSKAYETIGRYGINIQDLYDLTIFCININRYYNATDDFLEVVYPTNIRNSEIVEDLPQSFNLSLAKCRDLYYNGKYKEQEKRIISWGLALMQSDPREVVKILGGEVLTMEQAQRLANSFQKTKSDDRYLIDDDFTNWMHELKMMDYRRTLEEDQKKFAADQKKLEQERTRLEENKMKLEEKQTRLEENRMRFEEDQIKFEEKQRMFETKQQQFKMAQQHMLKERQKLRQERLQMQNEKKKAMEEFRQDDTRQTNQNIIINMLKNNFDDNTIMNITNVTAHELDKIKQMQNTKSTTN